MFAASGSCASNPDTLTCLSCGPIGICAEASVTCQYLCLDGDSSESSNGDGSIDFGGSDEQRQFDCC